MYHPTTRVLAVLELLQAQGRISGAEIASRLGVDMRTVRRYIATLEEMGIPVTAERGRAGGYSLVAGFKLPPMMFTDDEALALSVGLLAARGLGLAEAAPAVASAQAKLERIMPAGLRQRVSAVGETVQLDIGHASAQADNAALVALSGAAQSQLQTHLRYRDAAGAVSERDFDAYGLAYRIGCWYAVGFCHLRQDIRSFRLDRIETVRTLDERFERPAGFNPLAYLVQSVATLPRAHAVEVLLRTTLERARAQFFDGFGVFEQTGDGVVVHNQSDDIEWFARQLASAPFEFEIRHPPELRDAVRACGERLLGQAGGSAPGAPIILRDPRAGDMGWIVHRQAVLYAQEYGWNSEYEALVAEIVAKFVREFDPASERCWIAEQDGKVVGSVFVVRQDEATAKLRLLYVDPCARGLGLGRRLVDECLGFARGAGYRRMVLWTNSVLVDARRIYERAGFELVEENEHRSFGKDLIGQVWARDL
ncbi:MAG TPA: GNAT family N-acetyltransferase [Telluria sp.]|nr:GNAT family N-acetyltransferase [Telluria sp.]